MWHVIRYIHPRTVRDVSFMALIECAHHIIPSTNDTSFSFLPSFLPSFSKSLSPIQIVIFLSLLSPPPHPLGCRLIHWHNPNRVLRTRRSTEGSVIRKEGRERIAPTRSILRPDNPVREKRWVRRGVQWGREVPYRGIETIVFFVRHIAMTVMCSYRRHVIWHLLLQSTERNETWDIGNRSLLKSVMGQAWGRVTVTICHTFTCPSHNFDWSKCKIKQIIRRHFR